MQLFDMPKYRSMLDRQITDLVAQKPPTKALGIVQFGQDGQSSKYIQLKKAYCEQQGIRVEHLQTDSQQSVLEFFTRQDIGGTIVQLPLPQDKNFILSQIPQDKDIDCLNSSHFISPVVQAFNLFLNEISFPNSAVILGDGVLVGQPVAKYLGAKGLSVRVDHAYSTGTSLAEDLVVVGVGIPGLVRGEDLVAGANVVDFGFKSFDLDSKTDHLGLVSPSPGGMGPLVVRFLVLNFLQSL